MTSFVSWNKNTSDKILKNERFYIVKYWAKRFSTFTSYLVKVISKPIIFLHTLKNVLDKKVMAHFCVTVFLSTCALKSSKVAKIGTFIFLHILSRKKMNIFSTGCKQVPPKGHPSNVFKNVSQTHWKRFWNMHVNYCSHL